MAERPYEHVHAEFAAIVDTRRREGPSPLTPAELAVLDELRRLEAAQWTSAALNHPEWQVHE